MVSGAVWRDILVVDVIGWKTQIPKTQLLSNGARMSMAYALSRKGVHPNRTGNVVHSDPTVLVKLPHKEQSERMPCMCLA